MPGAEKLRDCALLEKMTKAQRDSGKMFAAICATPAVFFEVKIAVAWCRGVQRKWAQRGCTHIITQSNRTEFKLA